MDEISNDAAVDTEVIGPENTKDRPRLIPRTLGLAMLVGIQLGGLWALNFAGNWAVQKTALPVPGNLVGMLALYALMTLGVVKLAWLDLTGSFLIKHLAFFFVPITVGLMNSGPLLLAHGLGIMLVLVLSAAAGILLAGFVSQALLTLSCRQGDVP